jgi:predicted nucleic acid-binding protein
MSTNITLSEYLKLSKADKLSILRSLKIKIDLVERAVIETKSKELEDQLNRMLYNYNLGLGYLDAREV